MSKLLAALIGVTLHILVFYAVYSMMIQKQFLVWQACVAGFMGNIILRTLLVRVIAHYKYYY